MVFSNKPHYILMFIISFTLVLLFTTALDVSNAAAEAPSWGSGGDNVVVNQERRHVVVHNTIATRQPLNLHCKSSEVDFGMTQIPWGRTWEVSFFDSIPSTSKYRCHFTWYRGGDHYFDIFSPSRDGVTSGSTPPCTECIWDVGQFREYPMCRTNPSGSESYCFRWDA